MGRTDVTDPKPLFHVGDWKGGTEELHSKAKLWVITWRSTLWQKLRLSNLATVNDPFQMNYSFLFFFILHEKLKSRVETLQSRAAVHWSVSALTGLAHFQTPIYFKGRCEKKSWGMEMMILKRKPHTSIPPPKKRKKDVWQRMTNSNSNWRQWWQGYHPKININFFFSNNASITVLNYVGIWIHSVWPVTVKLGYSGCLRPSFIS